MNRITRFEALAERLVEGTFTRLFAERLSPLDVLRHLARAMEDHQVRAADDTWRAPTHYLVYLHPDDYGALSVEHRAAEIELVRQIAELAARAGLVLETTPLVHILPDRSVPLHEVRVEAKGSPEDQYDTSGTNEMSLGEFEESTAVQASALPMGRPFLILEGRRHVDLLQPVVSIGRALDNDVIIEDPRISRHHAQLRRRYGRYVLYDVGSSGGTQINGYPIEECVLHSGDVISFAGVQVIYGEDPPTPMPLPAGEDTPSLAHSTPGSDEDRL
jgi:hypothetical protein